MQVSSIMLRTLDLASHLRMCFYWTRRVTRSLELIWAIWYFFPDNTFQIQGLQSLDFLCMHFLSNSQGISSTNIKNRIFFSATIRTSQHFRILHSSQQYRESHAHVGNISKIAQCQILSHFPNVIFGPTQINVTEE